MNFNDINNFLIFFFFTLGSQATGALITVTGSLLGVLAGSIISRKSSRDAIAASNQNAIDLLRRQEFNKAATAFRISFIEEIRFIDRFYAEDRAGGDIPEVLSASADKHETALIIFKDGFLCEPQRIEIEKAWKAYTGDDKLMGKYTFRQYANNGIKNRIKGNDKIALDRINALLKFAEPKH